MSLALLHLLLHAAAGSADAGAQDSVGDAPEYLAAMERSLSEDLVVQRLALARVQDRRGLFEWARQQYEVVIGMDPNNHEAREALGYRIRDGLWVLDPIAGIPRVNRDRADSVLSDQRGDYLEGITEIAQLAARRSAEIARFARDNSLSATARRHWLEVLAYDPGNVVATTALDYRRSDRAYADVMPLPADAEVVEILEAFRAGPRAEQPAPELAGPDRAWAPDELRGNLRVAIGRYVGIQTDWMEEAWIRDLARWGDHSYSTACSLLGDAATPAVEAPLPDREPAAEAATTAGDRRAWFTYVDPSSSGYEVFAGWTHPGASRDTYAYLLSPDMQRWRDDARAFRVCRYQPQTVPFPDAAHLVPQFVVTRRLGVSSQSKAWIREGFAVLTEFIGLDTNFVWCFWGTATSQGERLNYRSAAATASLALGDLPFVAVYDTRDDSIHNTTAASKAASIWEWLLAQRGHDEAVAFFRALAPEDADPEQVIYEHFGWSPALFDEHWRRWAVAVWEAEQQVSDGGR